MPQISNLNCRIHNSIFSIHEHSWNERNKQASLIGVIPDYQIEDNPLTDKDEILDYTIEYYVRKMSGSKVCKKDHSEKLPK